MSLTLFVSQPNASFGAPAEQEPRSYLVGECESRPNEFFLPELRSTVLMSSRRGRAEKSTSTPAAPRPRRSPRQEGYVAVRQVRVQLREARAVRPFDPEDLREHEVQTLRYRLSAGRFEGLDLVDVPQ